MVTKHQDNTTAYDRLIDALRDHGHNVKDNGHNARTKCPNHNGTSNTSLAITAAPGKVLVYCHAGCDIDDVLAALNLTQTDLFDSRGGIRYEYSGGRHVIRTPDKRFRQRGNMEDSSLFQVEDIGDADTVYVTEGEQDAVNLATLCKVAAVSPPQGAKTPPEKWDWTPLHGKRVVIITDKDDIGRPHAERVAAHLKSIAASVEIMESAVGKDISDHIAAGKGVNDFVPTSLLDALGVTSDWLNDQTFPELQFAVPDLISEGLGLLVGPPKKGKSFLVGNLAIAVAAGGQALGHIPVKQRPVLVLALEDGHRRLQARYREINGGQRIPSGITFVTKATPQECIAVIIEYLNRYRDERPLIILDTLGKVKQARRSGDEAFQVDYALGSQFKSLIDSAPGSTLLVIHHTRKATAADFIDLVSGTQGLAGSVDFILALQRNRHEHDAVLSVTGRDITENEYALVAERGYLWRLDGDSLDAAANRANERRDGAAELARLKKLGPRAVEVVALVKERGCVQTSEVAFKVKMTPKRTNELLNRLADNDYIVKAGRGEFHSIRHAALSESADYADYEDSAESTETAETLSPGKSAQSSLSEQSAPSEQSAVMAIDSRRRNTCKCGARLTQPTSIKRGICAECWATESQ
jgi:hypothetical protein